MSNSSVRSVVLELVVSVATAAAFVVSCANIHVNALERTGQVSAIASVELRFLLFALPMLVLMIMAAKRGQFATTSRYVAAAFAGMTSAALAGGVLVMLHRTHYGLGALVGDSGVLIEWADKLEKGEIVSPVYPPLQTQLLAWMAHGLGMPSAYAIKWFQIVGIALVGPLSYASWRLLLQPAWALGVGVICALPLVEAYRQYPLLTLIVFIPISIKFLDVLRNCAEDSLGRLIRNGALFGLAFGIMFLLYSGWFQWSAPGFLVAALVLFPWRTGWRSAAILCGVAAIVFALLSARYLSGVFDQPIKDNYLYFDALVEPTYMAMWRGGLYGNVGVYPPLGELGGVGVFTVLLTIGTGAAVAFGRGRTVIIAVGSIMAGTWLFRFWYAHNMWRTKLVQLYPRTTAELLYCALILCAFAVYFAVERAQKRATEDSVLRAPTTFMGVFVGMVFLVMSSSSAMIDKYMPKDTADDPGRPAWVALKTPALEDTQTYGSTIETRSSHEDPPREAASYVIDRKRDRGYSSELSDREDQEEWIQLFTPTPREFSKVVLYPAADGFPVDFTLEVWDSQNWLPRVTKKNFPHPMPGPITFELGQMEATNGFRLHVTKLRKGADGYRLRIMELELYR